jgi:hypothetical protein
MVAHESHQMPRKARELSPLNVRRLNKPVRCSAGGVDGLALQVTESVARCWVLRPTLAGKQREMGLERFPSVTLVDARERACSVCAKAQEGADPIAERLAACPLQSRRDELFRPTVEALQ